MTCFNIEMFVDISLNWDEGETTNMILMELTLRITSSFWPLQLFQP